jgi:cell division septal protein FtsQ
VSAHYLRRPGQRAIRRSQRRRGLRRRALLLGAQIAALGTLCLLARQAQLWCLSAPLFEVRSIAVRGNQRARTADLLALASYVPSTNIFRVDLGRLRADLQRSPWVLSASFRRDLPNALEITVEERKPAAIVRFEGAAWLIDATGRRLAPFGPDVVEFEYPVLVGVEGLPRPEAVRRIRAGAGAIGALTAAMPDFAERISELDLSEPDRIAARLSDGSPLLYLDAHEPLRNIENYMTIRPLIARTLAERELPDPGGIAYIDLRFRGRIAVMPREASGEEPGLSTRIASR